MAPLLKMTTWSAMSHASSYIGMASGGGMVVVVVGHSGTAKGC